jgi:4-diphosphocytidyl-2-C-methyl-D-erythritol kinase
VLYHTYAKINLTLEVLRKRPDGFHELASLVHTINLGDDLHIEAADELLTRVEGLDIDPETNLVSRAAELLARTLGGRRGAELSLIKRIPSAAGLGGGSSDGATTLVGLNALWGSHLGLAALSDLAAELGSDIPFFVRGGAALMKGRGETLEPLPPWIGQWLVLLVPEHDVLDKTRRLYAALEPADFSDGSATQRAANRLADHATLGPDDCVNAFSRAARRVFPGLEETWEQAERTCQRGFFLSGAGPAVFTFCADRADARRQVANLGSLAPAYAVRTVKHARASIRFAAPTAIEYA